MTKNNKTGPGLRNQSTYIRIFILALLAPGLLVFSGCKDKVKPGTAGTAREAVSGVTSTKIIPSAVDEFYEASGTVKASNTSTISSRLMGTITSLKVREGERVHAGQVLITIDDRDVIQKVKAAEAGYREAQKALDGSKENRSLAETTYQRYKKLYDEKALSQHEIDQITTQKRVADLEYERVQEMVNRARAGLEEAKVYHDFTKITSPVSGIVTEKKTDPGSMAAPGMPLLTIENTSSFNVEISADEGLSGKLKTGMAVDVLIDALGKKISGRISEIVPSIDPMSRTFLVKIGVQTEGLKGGLYAKVRIPAGKKEALLVPAGSIVEKGQLTGVYAVDEKGVITYRLIRSGKRYDGGVEVLSGLNPGEKIITEGMSKAVDGGIIKQ